MATKVEIQTNHALKMILEQAYGSLCLKTDLDGIVAYLNRKETEELVRGLNQCLENWK